MPRTILNWSLRIFSFFSLLPLSSLLLHKSLIPLTRTTCPGSLLESSGIRSGSLVNNSNCTEKVELWQVGTNSVREDEKKGGGGGGRWKIDLKNPKVYTRRHVQSGAELSVSYVTSFIWTCEGQTRAWTCVFWTENFHFISWKWSFKRTFVHSVNRSTDTLHVTSLYNIWDVLISRCFMSAPQWWHYSLLKVH